MPSPNAISLAMGTVALVKTEDRSEGVRRSLALLGVNPVRGKEVLLILASPQIASFGLGCRRHPGPQVSGLIGRPADQDQIF